MAHFVVTLTTTQARAELSRLEFANRRMALATSAAYKSINFWLKGAVAGFLAMAGAMAASTVIVGEFNKNLTHTAALGALTDGEMDKLGNQVLTLAQKYGMSSNEISEGTVILAKAGLTFVELQAAMEPIAQLMMANSVSFEEAANISVMSINAYNKSYSDLTETLDVAQYVAQQTLLDIGELQQGLQYAASTASLAGVPFNELTTMMGILSQNAMVAGVASRSMNQMMLSLIKNADEVQRWANSMGLGVEVIKDGVLNINELIPAFANLGTNMELLQASLEFFTVRGMRSWAILVQNADDYLELLYNANNASGELTRTVEKQATAIHFVWGRIREALLSPFKTPEVQAQVQEAMRAFGAAIEDIGPRLQKIISNLMSNFVSMMPAVTGLIESMFAFLEMLLKILVPIGKTFGSLNKWTIALLIVWRQLRKMKIAEMLFGWSAAGKAYAASVHISTAELMEARLAEEAYKVSMKEKIALLSATEASIIRANRALKGETDTKKISALTTTLGTLRETEAVQIREVRVAVTNRVIATERAHGQQLVTNNALLQQKTQLIQMAAGAYVCMALGIMLVYNSTDKMMRIMMTLMTVISALVTMYAMLAYVSTMASPQPMLVGMIKIAAGAMILGVMAAALSPMKKVNSGSTTAGAATLAGQGGFATSSFQSGAHVITKPTYALLHRGEKVVQAHSPQNSGSGEININFHGPVMGDARSIARMIREEIAKLDRREMRRYYG